MVLFSDHNPRPGDEIGIAERELAAMETDIFTLLRQRRHLADLGLAVAKINHDLREHADLGAIVVRTRWPPDDTLSAAPGAASGDDLPLIGRSALPSRCSTMDGKPRYRLC
ncbi:MAG: hypothetical protein MO852_02500 [Candidatus Devosia euplotis]|nr:hypothetical protein [Candidatus Devosia euplotis]